MGSASGTGSQRSFCSPVAALVALILWPYYNYTFRFDPEELLRLYVDGDPDATMGAIHRTLLCVSRTTWSTTGEPFSGFGSRSSGLWFF